MIVTHKTDIATQIKTNKKTIVNPKKTSKPS